MNCGGEQKDDGGNGLQSRFLLPVVLTCPTVGVASFLILAVLSADRA